jgi:hypothetical protein
MEAEPGMVIKKSLKIPTGEYKNPEIEEKQTTQLPKEKTASKSDKK